MDRVLSKVVADGQLVEYAGGPVRGMSDAEKRERCRNAPESWKRSLDSQRATRGMPPLWPELRAVAAPATSQSVERRSVVPKPATKTIPPAYVLYGAATPGTSEPIVAATDGLCLPERFAPNAFARSLRSLKEFPVELHDGHGGWAIASTEDGTLKLWNDASVGLIVEASIANRASMRKLIYEVASGGVSLSVGFSPYRVEIERDASGKRTRVIHEAGLRHIALIRKSSGAKAAYRSRVRAVPWAKAGDAARRTAVLEALRIVCQQEGLL